MTSWIWKIFKLLVENNSNNYHCRSILIKGDVLSIYLKFSVQSPLNSASKNISNSTGIADPNISWSSSTIDKAVHTIFPNTFTQSQNVFKDCLGFAKQLSQSLGLYNRLEVKLGENSFKFQTGSHGKFPDMFPSKRKSPSYYRRDQKRKKPPGKGMPTHGNQGVSSVAPGDPTRAQKGIISWAPPSFLPWSRRVPWKKHLFSP